MASISESIKRWVDDEPSYKELLSWYIESEKGTVISLREALAKKDYSKLAYMGDMMYGHGATYGFFFISHIGKSIEKAAISEDDVIISILISELSRYLDFISNQK